MVWITITKDGAAKFTQQNDFVILLKLGKLMGKNFSLLNSGGEFR